MTALLAALVVGMLLQPVAANTVEHHPCEKPTEPLMHLLSSWSEISRAAENLPWGCNDGYFGEGISDTIARKIGYDWAGFLKELRRQPHSGKFFALVLSSLNATLDPDDIQTVFRLVSGSCPKDLQKQCQTIAKRASAALADYDPPITPKIP